MNLKTHSMLCAVLLFVSFAAKGQEQSSTDSIPLTQNRKFVNLDHIGAYAVVMNDSIDRKLFNGVNISNLLRGRVANVGMGSTLNSTVTNFRNVAPMYLIDGIPYRPLIDAYYNLNSFNFQTVGAVAGGNALSTYGGLAAAGSLILESKSGKDFAKPGFEANTTTLFEKTDGTSSPFANEAISEQWTFVNALAYSQDYGRVDARLSYINMYSPDGSSEGQTTFNEHAFKGNLGIEISPKFSARFIADLSSTPRRTKTEGFETRQAVRNMAGNLFLNYKINSWVTLTSQSHFIKSKGKTDTKFTSGSYTFDHPQHRAFVNMLATLNPSMSDNFAMHLTVGGQMERQVAEEEQTLESSSLQQRSWLIAKAKTRSLVGNITLMPGKYLTLQSNYRYHYWVDVSNDPSTYSVSAAFDFRNASKLGEAWLAKGFLRGNVGKTQAVESNSYPFESTVIIGITPQFLGYISPYLQNTERRYSELGVDLAFFDSRLLFQTTYFKIANDQTMTYIPVPSGGSQLNYVIESIGENQAKGFEATLGYDFIRGESKLLTGRLIYSSYDFAIDLLFENFNQYTQYFSAAPSWSGCLLLQFQIGRLFGRVLPVHQSGGEVKLVNNFTGEFQTVGFTQTTLRDVAFGYSFPNISVSVLARNLWASGDISYDDFHQGPGSTKAVSVSASFQF